MMLVEVFKKELREHLLSGRYQLAALLILCGMLIAGWNSAKSTVHLRQLLSARQSIEESRLAEQARSLITVAYRGRPALKSGDKLEFLIGTSERQLPDEIRVNVEQILAIRNGRLSNPTFSDLFELDWTFIIFYLVSFAALLLSFDAVCGERAQGTLQLLLSHPLSRGELLLGKYLALLVCLGGLLLVGSIINLLLVWKLAGLSLSLFDLARAALIWLAGLLFMAVLLSFGLLGSALFRSSVAALLTLIFVWVIMVQVIPSLSKTAVTRWAAAPAQDAVEAQLSRRLTALAQEEMATRPIVNGNRILNRRRVPPSPIELHYFDYRLRMTALARATWEDYYQKQLRQADLADQLADLSPACLFRAAVESLTGGGIAGQRNFLEQARVYQAMLGEFVKQKDQLDDESPHVYFADRLISERPVTTSAIPRFSYQTPRFGQALAAALPRLGGLIAAALVFLLLSFILMNRYDARA